jgi:uncharacterized membrane protein
MQKLIKIPLYLLILLLWTVFAVVIVYIPFLNSAFLRQIFTLPVLLFIPGYVTTVALYPKKDSIEAIERIALSFGFSIAAASLFGLFFKVNPGKLTSLMIVLCIFTIVLVFIAAYRLGKLHEEMQYSAQFDKIYELIYYKLNTNKSIKNRISTGILIFTVVLAISMLYFVITVPKIGEKFSEFYILGPGGKANNYTTDLKYNQPADILISVINHEYRPVNYTVQVVLEKEILTDTWFRLNHDQTWKQNISYIPDITGTDLNLEFLLFKEDNFTAPYQKLNLWVDIRK